MFLIGCGCLWNWWSNRQSDASKAVIQNLVDGVHAVFGARLRRPVDRPVSGGSSQLDGGSTHHFMVRRHLPHSACGRANALSPSRGVAVDTVRRLALLAVCVIHHRKRVR